MIVSLFLILLLVPFAVSSEPCAPQLPDIERNFAIHESSGAIYQVLTCVPPTERTDETPFDASTELKEYEWFFQIGSGFEAVRRYWTRKECETLIRIVEHAPIKFGVRAVPKVGEKSGDSNTVNRTVTSYK